MDMVGYSLLRGGSDISHGSVVVLVAVNIVNMSSYMTIELGFISTT